ncbi:MAG: alcohol dehydrogenase catalytic domain-containing protein, partial [Croceimicrobium sp.]
MLAIVKRVYGGPEVLSIQEMPIPLAQEDEVLIKVKANSANPADWHILRGKPYFARLSFGLFKPKDPILGSDFAGIVEAKGSKVENLNIGDRVYGENLGNAFAEYLVAKENIL